MNEFYLPEFSRTEYTFHFLSLSFQAVCSVHNLYRSEMYVIVS